MYLTKNVIKYDRVIKHELKRANAREYEHYLIRRCNRG